MKTLGSLLLVLCLAACSPPLPTVNVGDRVLFGPSIGINIYQGPDDNGIFLAKLDGSQGKWFTVPAGFEMLYFEFSNGRGGDHTVSINVQAMTQYYFIVTQRSGHLTPDVVVKQVSSVPNVKNPPTKAGMAQIYVYFDNAQAKKAYAEKQARLEELKKNHCSENDFKLGNCQLHPYQ